MFTSVFTSLIFSFLFLSNDLKEDSNYNTKDAYLFSENKDLSRYKRGSFYIVTAYRAYFYSGPSYNSITKKFLVSGNDCQILKFKNGFGYVVYYNQRVRKTTSGWLDLNDLEEVIGCSH
jgi:hypothetical protein